MATLRYGNHKGKEVELHQWCNDWVMTKDGAIHSPASLQFTRQEFAKIIHDKNNGILLNIYKPDYEGYTFRKYRRGESHV